MKKGIVKLLLNRSVCKILSRYCRDIQTVLRREGYPQPYEALKALTRTNEGITENSIQNFIDTLEITDTIKDELKKITPHNYTGVALV